MMILRPQGSYTLLCSRGTKLYNDLNFNSAYTLKSFSRIRLFNYQKYAYITKSNSKLEGGDCAKVVTLAVWSKL